MKKIFILFSVGLATATTLQWKIPLFDYHESYTFTTPAHQNSWGIVDFNLTNDLVSYATPCKAQNNRMFDFYGEIPAFACTPPDEAPLGAAANFRFNKRTGQLDVEGWVDREEKVLVAGSINITLTCTDKTTVNENWVLGEVYSQRDVNCPVADLVLRGTE
ncbi:hypothetical protein B0T14DRAFT_421388 [Immersiella caudata]|uniref:AA1-like domain-containing protein n=1 Tax=Immersiella caudata TaxID=314043 RepID=A0AA39X2Z2_9PEZI|nr:hypothetical protein B0T14DRAFT_421388 [Immersiella caudata]